MLKKQHEKKTVRRSKQKCNLIRENSHKTGERKDKNKHQVQINIQTKMKGEREREIRRKQTTQMNVRMSAQTFAGQK